MTAQQHRRIGPGAPRAMLGGRTALAVGAGVMLAGSILLGLRSPVTAAPANQLLNPGLKPAGGTTNTSFTFAVTYRSGQGNQPTSVTALAGNVVIPLTLVSGSAANGRYRGSARLAAGTWTVTFQATAHGNDPSVDGPTVVVRAAPVPTRMPRPKPRPTPKPTARPTVAAAVITPPPSSAPQTTEPRTPRPASEGPRERPRRTPEATPTPGGEGPIAGGVGSPTARPTRDPSSAGGVLGASPLVTMLTGTLIALAVLALIGMFAILAARRRRKQDTRLELLPHEAREMPGIMAQRSAAPRAAAVWERDWALDEAPIGSVEYRPQLPGEPADDDDGA
jgi:hypothetical protein